jgi:type IV pilus biogenesis protein CpaD/CtpE
MQVQKVILAAALAVLLGAAGGCVTTTQHSLGPDFGNSVQANSANQVIDPLAGLEETDPNTLDGRKGELALDRYRTEQAEAETRRLITDIN